MSEEGILNNDELGEMLALIGQYPFATLVSVVAELPVMTLLPLTAKIRGDKIELTGHMARSNPHSKKY